MEESFKQKMQENKPHLTFKNTKKNICLEKKREFFTFLWVYTLTPIGQGGVAAAATYFYQLIQEGEGGVKEIHIIFGRVAFENRC